jgi:hypothetical protein
LRCIHIGERSPGGARAEQRASGGLAEVRGEERRPAQLAHHQVLDLVRLGQEVGRVRHALAVGQADHDAVVRPDRLDLGLAALAQPRAERQRPGRVHAPPHGVSRHRRQSPISSRVRSEHDRAVVGTAPPASGRAGSDEVLGGDVGQRVLLDQAAASRPRAARPAARG